MAETDAKFRRVEGVDLRNPELPTFPVPISQRLAGFWGDVFNKELVLEINYGNISIEGGDQGSLTEYLQQQFGIARGQDEPKVDLSQADVSHCGIVYNIHRQEGILPVLEEDFSPLTELQVSFGGVKMQQPWERRD